MLDQDNCVARLRAIAGKLSQRPERAVPAVLAEALGTNPYTMELPRHLAAFEDLAKRARQQIDEISDHPSYSRYVEVIDRIIAIFNRLDMRENWSRYASAFDTRAMTRLEDCEDTVRQWLTTTPPSEEALREVLADIQQAISGILDADIETEAKEVLLEILREVERALQLYHISGVAGLRRAFDRMVGGMAIHWRLIERSRGHEAVERVFNALGRFVIVADMIGYLTQLPGYLKQLPGVDSIIKMLPQ